MPLLKIHHIISFSSEDPKHTVSEFIKGNGQWLCNSEDKSVSMTMEFQLEKPSVIDYIDIGNFNTLTITVEVGKSSWPSSKKFSTMLPAVTLMSPIDCRTERNTKSVRMFKKGDFSQEIIKDKWDRIRLTCSNPYRKNSQFGLQFMKIFIKCDDPLVEKSDYEDKNSFLSRMKSHIKITDTTSPKLKSSLSTIPHIKQFYNGVQKTSSSTKSNPPSLKMKSTDNISNVSDAKESKTLLELEALDFLITLKLTSITIHSLKVSHIREEFEFKRNNILTKPEKIIFKDIALDYAAEILKKHEHEDIISESRPQNSSPFAFRPIKEIMRGKENNNSGTFTESVVNISENSPISKKKRNELALEDCKMTPKKRVRKVSDSNSSISTLGVWLQPNKNKVPKASTGLPKNKHNSSSKKRPQFSASSSTFDLIVDSSESEDEISIISYNKNVSESTPQKLGEIPRDKFGTNSRTQEICAKQKFDVIECPLCAEMLPQNEIEYHAASCSLNKHSKPTVYQNPKDPIVDFKRCPICNMLISSSYIEEHAAGCGNKRYR